MKLSTRTLAAGFLLAALPAQDATVTVLHGIPCLGAPVTVAANGANLFSFDFRQVATGNAKVAVRHLAAAPTVDVVVGKVGNPLATIPALSNGTEAVANLPLGQTNRWWQHRPRANPIPARRQLLLPILGNRRFQ
jgi:hypothetical protein